MVNRMSGLQTRLVLRNLIRLCKNGERGFAMATEGLTDGEMRGIFRRFARLRAQQAAEVGSELEQECPGARDEDLAEDVLPCGWTHIRSALNSEGESGLINKCGEGTECLLKTYEEVLKAPWPVRTRAVLHRHMTQTRSMQGVLQSLARLD